MDNLHALKHYKKSILKNAETHLAGRKDGRYLVKNITIEVDHLIREAWRLTTKDNFGAVDIVATGGYGRSELSPHSDWDLLILVPEKVDNKTKRIITKFTQLIWDVGGNLGHSVRSIKDAKKFFNINHHARTAFLEARLLIGNGVLFNSLWSTENPQVWDIKKRKDFCQQKIEECFARHQKHGDTAFCMEPDCKNGKGGLRDVSTIFWLSMAWYQVPAARQLVSEGIVRPDEFKDFVKAREFLWRVRTALHLLSNRENDRLNFEYQLKISKQFRFRENKTSGSVERFLKKYFLNVRTIANLSDIFLLHFQELISPLSGVDNQRRLPFGLKIENNVLKISDEELFISDPVNLLRIFRESQKSSCQLSSRTLRQVREYSRAMTAAVRIRQDAGNVFLDILRSPVGVTRIIRQMHETGVLGKFCPDFAKITGHGQFDRYHHYTVDAHTIRAIAYARDVSLMGKNPTIRLAKKLMSELEKPELLYLAVLYHDIAKGGGADHSKLGETLARKFCSRIGLGKRDTSLVAWLVLYHLRLSKVAQHYNLSDPDVVRKFSEFIGDRERLIYLFLLTLIDVAAVGPGTLTDWKCHLFEQLFRSVENSLISEQVDMASQNQRTKEKVLDLISSVNEEERVKIAESVKFLPDNLILNLPFSSLELVCELIASSEGIGVQIQTHKGYTKLLTLGQDRKGLLASLSAGLAALNIKILTAKTYTIKDSRVLDEFHITDDNDNSISEPSQLKQLEDTLMSILSGAKPPSIPVTRKHDVLMRAVTVRVRQHFSASHSLTAIEVVAANRNGLLANLAGAISEQNLMLRGASVSTFGEEAVDIFFVADASGNKIDEQKANQLISRLRAVASLP